MILREYSPLSTLHHQSRWSDPAVVVGPHDLTNLATGPSPYPDQLCQTSESTRGGTKQALEAQYAHAPRSVPRYLPVSVTSPTLARARPLAEVRAALQPRAV